MTYSPIQKFEFFKLEICYLFSPIQKYINLIVFIGVFHILLKYLKHLKLMINPPIQNLLILLYSMRIKSCFSILMIK